MRISDWSSDVCSSDLPFPSSSPFLNHGSFSVAWIRRHGLASSLSYGTNGAEAAWAALNRSQAVIEFALDGTILTAKANFLGLMDYRLEEIAGKHYRIFCAPDHAQSPDYADRKSPSLNSSHS